MFSFFSLSGSTNERESREAQWLAWKRDPLSHPDLARMSLRELGDLPLFPVKFRQSEKHCADQR